MFAVKGGRYITHLKRLVEVRVPLANFLASGVLALGDKLGPLLWQLPADLEFEQPRMRRFLAMLPRDTSKAKTLARAHDTKVAGRTWLERSPVRPLRHAVEVRHESFHCTSYMDLLHRFRVANVVSDSAGTWPMLGDVTSDFAYVRLHGHDVLYGGGYPTEALLGWADQITNWTAAGLDVYAYFDNDADGRAPHDAIALRRLLRT